MAERPFNCRKCKKQVGTTTDDTLILNDGTTLRDSGILYKFECEFCSFTMVWENRTRILKTRALNKSTPRRNRR